VIDLVCVTHGRRRTVDVHHTAGDKQVTLQISLQPI
jgi:hypothetical protein